MEMNVVVLAGRLAADAELKTFDSGATMARCLMTVRQEEPRRRLDVVPVVIWNPDPDDVAQWKRGVALWVAGSVQRRFWSQEESGRMSRIEIVAQEVTVQVRGDIDA